ncbi:hypothetical protein [Fontivita pretiosa]|uniref:hypothetical protein n=1 Tax=Fontivita pretiosa TaxID=2989684 RepID=UPI003D16F09D
MMRQRRLSTVSRFSGAIIATACAPLAWALPAFPGAEGYGANAVGGRGGEVFHVTSLADTNTGTYSSSGFKGGTLRYCLQHSSSQPRTIVFDISGTIVLTSSLTINRSNLTVAGQTAPGQGITLRNYTFAISGSNSTPVSNVVVRHIRSRKGNLTDSEDAIGVLGGSGSLSTVATSNVVLDHVSASWGEDEALSLTNHSTNVTVQHSFVAEALLGNDGSAHNYGSLLRPQISSRYTLHHNLWANNISRNPRPGSYFATPTDRPHFDLRNNVIYNFKDRAGYTGGSSTSEGREYLAIDFVGNYTIAGPSTTGSPNIAFTVTSNATASIFQENNLIDADRDAVRDGINTGTAMFLRSGDGSMTLATSSVIDPPPVPVTTESASAAYQRVLLRGGAMPWARDAVDLRIVNQIRTGGGAIVNSQDDVGGWPTLISISRPAGWDSDFDGMPNWWELARGHNPSLADHNATAIAGDYTNLEKYLNYITATSNWGIDADGSWSNHDNWLGGAPDGADALAGFNASALSPGFSGPRTVIVDSPRTVGMLSFDSLAPFTIVGTSPITLDDSSGSAAVVVLAGNHAIAAPLNLADNTAVVVMPAESTLQVTGAMAASGKIIIKHGAGAAQFENIRAAGLTVNQGVVSISPKPQAGNPAGTSVMGSLSISPGARLDLNNNSLILNTASLATVTGLVKTALDNGGNFDWQGPGIGSTQAHVQNTAAGSFLYGLGVVLNDLAQVGGSGPIYTAFGGQTTSGGEVLVKFTYFGDADLSGSIDATDYSLIDNGYVNSLSGWINGDFDYSGVIDATDYALIDNAYVNQVGALAEAIIAEHAKIFGGEYLAALRAVQSGVIPEPAALGVMAIGLLWSGRHGRQKTEQPS